MFASRYAKCRGRIGRIGRIGLIGLIGLTGLPGGGAWSPGFLGSSALADKVLADEALASSRLAGLAASAPGDFDPRRVEALRHAAEQLETWAAGRVWNRERVDPDQVLAAVKQLAVAKQQTDRLLDETLKLRGAFVEMRSPERREAIRHYLQFTSQAIDLSGRMRYLMRDAIDTAAYDLETNPKNLERLLDVLLEHRVSIGAVVMAYVLLDPPADSGLRPFPRPIKVKALQLISRTSQVDALPQLAEFVRQKSNSPDLTVAAAEVIHRVGLPQDPIPGQDPTLPEPSITAGELKEILDDLPVGRLSPELQAYYRRLQQMLTARVREGIAGETFRVGNLELRSGDWLLMRNPSPYNLFTDLSPGLFTHVGVVSTRRYEDGVRRFVIVDLPERGDSVPATNVDTYLLRTLHYFFLRHDDPAVGERMGEVARQMIGNESVFDLTFQTDRVLALKGQPLEGKLIHTYCAGFLLLCAQETTAPREQFFPIEEFPAGGKCSANLKKLGLSIGDNFVSPTGAVFSPRLQLVGSRDPMYSPDREIKEAIYDHFARSMIDKRLTPSPDVLQSLRQKVAELARFNPWLARFLARTNNVNEKMDLVSAAKAAAAIETLDEVANTAAREYAEARQALLAGPLEPLPTEPQPTDTQSTETLPAEPLPPETRRQIESYRERHADLFGRLANPGLSPRQLRIALVDYYSQWGRERIDSRFFPDSPAGEEMLNANGGRVPPGKASTP